MIPDLDNSTKEGREEYFMNLKLYMFDTCPYCRKVINEIEASGRTDIEYHIIFITV